MRALSNESSPSKGERRHSGMLLLLLRDKDERTRHCHDGGTHSGDYVEFNVQYYVYMCRGRATPVGAYYNKSCDAVKKATTILRVVETQKSRYDHKVKRANKSKNRNKNKETISIVQATTCTHTHTHTCASVANAYMRLLSFCLRLRLRLRLRLLHCLPVVCQSFPQVDHAQSEREPKR